MAARRRWLRPNSAENRGSQLCYSTHTPASLDKRASPPQSKRANSLAGEDIDEDNCFRRAGARPARRPSLAGRCGRLRRWSLSRRLRRTPWRGGHWPSAIRLPRRRGRATGLWRALLLAPRRARLSLNGSKPRAAQAPASFAIAGANCAAPSRNAALSAVGSRGNWPSSPISII
jgi:hypothetical protein